MQSHMQHVARYFAMEPGLGKLAAAH